MIKTLLGAATECERAYVGDTTLDRSVWAAAVAQPPANPKAVGEVTTPAYTTSLDAANSLIPEGRYKTVEQNRTSWVVYLSRYDHLHWRLRETTVRGTGSTEALATCSAALQGIENDIQRKASGEVQRALVESLPV